MAISLFPEDETSELLALLGVSDAGFSFVRRPNPVDGNLRLAWRLSLLVITLGLCCRGGRSSLRRLQVLNWAVRTPRSRSTFLSALEGRSRPQDVLVRTDPILNKVLQYARGEKLIDHPRADRAQLTELGRAASREILADQSCLATERTFFESIGQRVTEDWISSTLSEVGHP
jgi:hypothetical protein